MATTLDHRTLALLAADGRQEERSLPLSTLLHLAATDLLWNDYAALNGYVLELEEVADGYVLHVSRTVVHGVYSYESDVLDFETCDVDELAREIRAGVRAVADKRARVHRFGWGFVVTAVLAVLGAWIVTFGGGAWTLAAGVVCESFAAGALLATVLDLVANR